MTATMNNIEEMELSQIVPPHGVQDRSKLKAIVASMTENGWQGRPLLVVETQGMYQALTGSHRYAAARSAGIEMVPCVIVNYDLLQEAGYDTQDFCEDDERTLEILREVGDTAAADLMLEEINAN